MEIVSDKFVCYVDKIIRRRKLVQYQTTQALRQNVVRVLFFFSFYKC